GCLACEPGEEVERVDALREQYAAAVPRSRAASRLVVIALRAPVRNRGRCRDERAQSAGGDKLVQLLCCGSETVLEHDAQRDFARRAHELFASLQRDLKR